MVLGGVLAGGVVEGRLPMIGVTDLCADQKECNNLEPQS